MLADPKEGYSKIGEILEFSLGNTVLKNEGNIQKFLKNLNDFNSKLKIIFSSKIRRGNTT